ncbi:hypothetical protein ACIBF1_44175 [Spirillospora sp. NPDC050679]
MTTNTTGQPDPHADLARHAAAIITALARHNRAQAIQAFRTAAADHTGDGVTALLNQLGQMTAVPAGVIRVGLRSAVFGNPLATDWVWRCGTCRNTAGLNYDTFRTARWAAELHAENRHPTELIGIDTRGLTPLPATHHEATP